MSKFHEGERVICADEHGTVNGIVIRQGDRGRVMEANDLVCVRWELEWGRTVDAVYAPGDATDTLTPDHPTGSEPDAGYDEAATDERTHAEKRVPDRVPAFTDEARDAVVSHLEEGSVARALRLAYERGYGDGYDRGTEES